MYSDQYSLIPKPSKLPIYSRLVSLEGLALRLIQGMNEASDEHQ